MNKLTHSGNCLLAAFVIGVFTLSGCSQEQKSGRPEVDDVPADELRGAGAKATLYELRAKVRKHGLKAVQQEVPQAVEVFEAYAKASDTQHGATYTQIAEKLKSMQGATSKDAAVKTANEIGDLADKLPGKADANPQVE